MLEVLQQIVNEKRRQGLSYTLILNYLKEYLQVIILNLIYNNPKLNRQLIFKGGSCLRIIYNLPRLSEDLDFDIKTKKPAKLLSDLDIFLGSQLNRKYLLPVETKIQSNIRLYLKFPILARLGLTSRGESNKLYVKIEVSPEIIPQAKFEISPISQAGFNFVIYHYDLATLMVGKLNAFFSRVWFKGKDNQITIKGRDFYDLYWFLNQKVQPNWPALKVTLGIDDNDQLKARIWQRLEKVNSQQIAYDLKNFVDDPEFVDQLGKNYKKLISKFL